MIKNLLLLISFLAFAAFTAIPMFSPEYNDDHLLRIASLALSLSWLLFAIKQAINLFILLRRNANDVMRVKMHEARNRHTGVIILNSQGSKAAMKRKLKAFAQNVASKADVPLAMALDDYVIVTERVGDETKDFVKPVPKYMVIDRDTSVPLYKCMSIRAAIAYMRSRRHAGYKMQIMPATPNDASSTKLLIDVIWDAAWVFVVSILDSIKYGILLICAIAFAFIMAAVFIMFSPLKLIASLSGRKKGTEAESGINRDNTPGLKQMADMEKNDLY